jgi:hypothetical protein
MQMFTPNGDAIRLRRKQRSRRMKSFAHEIGVSERTLRDIERHNKSIGEVLAARISSALKIDRSDVLFATDGPRLVVTPPALVPPPTPVHTTNGKQLVPRFDRDSARDIGSGEALFDHASRCDLVIAEARIPMDSEISGYVAELVSLIEAASWMHRERFSDLAPDAEVAMRKRMRHLLVQLRGNDIWTYALNHTKHLPVSDDVPEKFSADVEWHAMVVFGPPGEYGENTVEVDVDNGHPWIIDWDEPLFSPPLKA